MEQSDPVELREFLTPYPLEVQDLALSARALLLDLLSPVSEIHYDAISAVCAGYTYTEKVTDNFFNLAVYGGHVTLIFPWGAKLHDPERRLKGDGSRVRNIRLTNLEMLKDPYVLDLIDQASAMAVRPAVPIVHRVIVKVMKGPKRRPRAT